MSESKTILSVNVHVTGVKKRCRKVDRHMFEVGDFPLDVNRTELAEKAIEIVKSNMKTITGTVKLGLTKTNIENDGGMMIRSFMMFSGQEYIDLTSNFTGGEAA